MSFWNRAIGLRRHRRDRAKQQERKRRQSRRLLLETLERRELLTGGPEIEVRDHWESEVYDGSDVSFESTSTGSPVSRTFTIQNTGTENLTLDLESLTLPYGFSLLTPLPSEISSGGSTSFVIQLDATSMGWYGGQLSFANNDSDESPFDLYLYGDVNDYGGGYGGDAYGGDSYGGQSYGGDAYGGDSYGGGSYGIVRR